MESEANDVNNIDIFKPSCKNKKVIYQAIQKRMEFYFSDANLSKDRFMTNLLNEDPHVDPAVFLKFNKIRALTSSVKDIIKALKKSTLLSISEDKTKIYRTAPVKVKENEDECTVYVEQLPLDADHDWLSGIFSQFGKVDYISVPKFKHSGKIKGFAFIEYETPESAKKALDAFSSAGCKLPSTLLPNQLCSIATFDRNEKDVVKNRKLFGFSNENTNKEVETCDGDEIEKKQSSKKRWHEPDSPQLSKKIKRQDREEIEEENKKKDVCKSKKKKGNEIIETDTEMKASAEENTEASHTDTGNESCSNELLDSSESEMKKKRKRKKKKKNKKDKLDITSSGLQILSKCEWKKLRNKYLELQRSKMNSLKQYLNKIKYDDNQHIIENSISSVETHDEKDISKAPRVQYSPGVILKLIFDEPIVDVKAFKNEVKSHNGVEYVDVNEGAFVAFVRCSSCDISQQLNTEKLSTNSLILQGEEEKNYWEKILKDREEKLSKKIQVNQKGRTKLLKKAEKALGKRIRFDSD